MQAKNYAAQAQVDIKNGAIDFRRFSKDIEDSIIFSLPNNGKILESKEKNIKYEDLRLPFQKVVLQFFYEVPPALGKSYQVIVLAEETEKTIEIYNFFKWLDKPNRKWNVNPYMTALSKVGCVFPNESDYLDGEIYSEALYGKMPNELIEYSKNMRRLSMYVVFEFLEALSCRNVEQTTIQKCDAALNARRVNKGKLPLYEERILTIKVNAKQGTGTRTGTHQSPRQHLRRGHIRRLESGNIWVNACVVGNSEKGVIKKSYNVAA